MGSSLATMIIRSREVEEEDGSEETLSDGSLSTSEIKPATVTIRGIWRFIRPKDGDSPVASSSKLEYDLETMDSEGISVCKINP